MIGSRGWQLNCIARNSLTGGGIPLGNACVNECPPDYPIDNSKFEEQAEWGYLDLPRRGEEDEEW